MIILNETIIIDPEIEKEWLKWIRHTYIPAVMATGHFTGHRMLTVLNSPNEGITYCLQFNAADVEGYYHYQQTHIVQIRETHFKQFENRFVLFETIMELVD
jgi:hypothetical protein